MWIGVFMTNLPQLRKDIDLVDLKILNLVAQRRKLVIKIMQEKSKQGMPLADKKREREIVSHLISRKKLSASQVRALWKVLFGMSHKLVKKNI